MKRDWVRVIVWNGITLFVVAEVVAITVWLARS